MNSFSSPSILLLETAAALQMAIAALNLFLVRILKWREDMARMPLLLRQVFQVHLWFISFTLAIFAVLTWRFAPEIAGKGNPVCQSLAATIGLFWGTRTVLQIVYYSSSHWRGKPARTCIHALMLVLYGSLAILYLYSGVSFGPK